MCFAVEPPKVYYVAWNRIRETQRVLTQSDLCCFILGWDHYESISLITVFKLKQNSEFIIIIIVQKIFLLLKSYVNYRIFNINQIYGP